MVIGLAVLLMALPLLSLVYLPFSDFLTRIVEKYTLYKYINDWVLPYQTALVKQITSPFVPNLISTKNGFIINGAPIVITWNCIGWQSMILFIVSLFLALVGKKWTLKSKLITVIIGLVGIFWENILRMSFIIILFSNDMSLFKVIFHDYLAAVTTVLWLIFFWWFAYKFVLEEK